MFLFSKSPNALFHCVAVSSENGKCICFRSHKMLQQMIIFDGDDAGWQSTKGE